MSRSPHRRKHAPSDLPGHPRGHRSRGDRLVRCRGRGHSRTDQRQRRTHRCDCRRSREDQSPRPPPSTYSPRLLHRRRQGLRPLRRARPYGRRRARPSSRTRCPPGYGPADLQSAYKLPARPPAPARPSPSSTPTTTRTPSPTSPSTARSTACRPAPPPTAASARSTRPAAPPLPGADAGWAGEISLDLDMVSRDLPELPHPAGRGDTPPAWPNLGTAVNEAVALGAKYVSNSYGGGDSAARPRRRRTSTTRAWRSPRAPATTASASSTRPPSRTSPRSAAPR